MHTNFLILSLVFLKLLIVSVAFFLGHPVYKVESIKFHSKLIDQNLSLQVKYLLLFFFFFFFFFTHEWNVAVIVIGIQSYIWNTFF